MTENVYSNWATSKKLSEIEQKAQVMVHVLQSFSHSYTTMKVLTVKH